MVIIISLGSCGITRDTPKYQFADGYYTASIFNKKPKKVYVNNEEATISVYPAIKARKGFRADTTEIVRLFLPQQKTDTLSNSLFFRQTSFDIDFLTIPFKYRPPADDFPRQFNTALNGACYLGFRTDMFQLRYKPTPIGQFIRQKNHYGFSFGVFTGLGGTTMNPSVTGNQIAIEYDGLVWAKGFAAILGVDNFSVGLAAGWDDLLDNNKIHWIYQQRPWLV